MKLIKEYINKVIIWVIIFSILMEFCIFSIIYFKSREIYFKVYQDNIIKSENKSYELTKKIEEYTSDLILKYLTDIKLICKHSLLLNGKKVYNITSTINRDSNILNINNQQKDIIIAKMEDLLEKEYMKKLINDNGFFDYNSKYEEEFKNISDRNEILKILFSDFHKELNTIGYYSLSKNQTEEILSTKFLISILKTIYIRRYITKRFNNDYIHFLILNKDEIYIYPPQAYNNINLYHFNEIYPYPYSDCLYSSNNKTQQFPLCVYNYLVNKIISKEDNILSIIYEAVFYNRIFAAFCLKLPFIKNNPNQAIICIEIDFSKFFSSANFNNPEKFEFGIFFFDQLIIPLVYSRSYSFSEFEYVYNDTIIELYRISYQNDVILSLFHYLYFNLTKTAKEHPELNVNFTEIEEEFNIINNKIISEIEEFNKNKSTGINLIKIPFTKSICKKKLLYNDYECYKDEFEMIIIPSIFKLNKLNEDYIETGRYIEDYFRLYIFSVISTNPKSNGNKIFAILKIKLIRTIILFAFLTMIILSLFFLLINLISEFSLSFNTINSSYVSTT